MQHAKPDDEVLSTPMDNQAAGKGMPRHDKGRKSLAAPKRPVLWNLTAVEDLAPAPVFGMYPRGFLDLAVRHLGCSKPEVLHVCSGGLSSYDAGGGLRIDLRREARPSVIADGRELPFLSGSFKAVLIDPPYSLEYAAALYGQEYPRPSALLREAVRVTKPCGKIGFVHFLVPSPPSGCTIERILALTTGVGYRIRAFTIFRRDQDVLEFAP